MRVLIVHEERALADYLAGFLHNYGYDVLPLYSPFDAMSHFLEVVQFDVALISIGLRELTGEELADVFRIEAFQPGCRVIPFGRRDEVEELRSRKPESEYLTLPFSNEELLSLMRGGDTSGGALTCLVEHQQERWTAANHELRDIHDWNNILRPAINTIELLVLVPSTFFSFFYALSGKGEWYDEEGWHSPPIWTLFTSWVAFSHLVVGGLIFLASVLLLRDCFYGFEERNEERRRRKAWEEKVRQSKSLTD
jgi:hypothetical protein